MSESRRLKVRIEEVLLKYGITLPEAPLDAVAAGMKRMGNNAVAEEREACALMIGAWPTRDYGSFAERLCVQAACIDMAAAIRARGKVGIP
jgi:hypothetical protein